MASTKTGEELISGHNNSANNTTAIIADKQSSGSPGRSWNNRDRIILLATATKDPNKRPTAKLDGIVGIANRGGAGVRGVGSQPEGPRGPNSGSGNGGDGVVGHGGTGDLV